MISLPINYGYGDTGSSSIEETWNYWADKAPDTILIDAGLRDRQKAGITALIALANNSPYNSWLRDPSSRTVEIWPGKRYGQSASKKLAELLRRDHMMRNSLFLMLNSGLQAGFGFAFWIITARLFSTADVGRASALISATTVIAYLALLGLNNTLGRYLPTTDDRNALIGSGLTLVAVFGAVIATGYVYLTPFIAPRLAFVEQSPELTAGFAFLTAAAALNILTDSVFVASRKAN